MKAAKNYVPTSNESIAIFNEEFGYIGVATEAMQPVGLNKTLGEHEYWTYETVGDLFALKNVYSGMYIGYHNHLKGQPSLIDHRERGELFFYTVLRNGLVTINNMLGYHLSCKGGELTWAITTTSTECWRLIAPYNKEFYLTTKSKVTSLAMPLSGTSLAVVHVKGGYLGGTTNPSKPLRVVP